MLICPALTMKKDLIPHYPEQREEITCQERLGWRLGRVASFRVTGFPTRHPALFHSRSKCVKFSPSGTSFAVASTDGLMIFSQDASITYAPVELSEDVTPDAVSAAVSEGRFTHALVVRENLTILSVCLLAKYTLCFLRRWPCI
jgi:hypothetical protein